MTATALPLKAGDTVRVTRLLCVIRGAMVVLVYDHGRQATVRIGDERCWDVLARDVDRLSIGSESDERDATLWASTATDSMLSESHRGIARAYALRRGWRPLDREDVTAVPITTWVYDPSGAYLGRITKVASTFQAKHTSQDCTSPPVSGLPSYEEALDVILAAENQRRAALGASTTENTP